MVAKKTTKRTAPRNIDEVHEQMKAAATTDVVDIGQTVQIDFLCAQHGHFQTETFKVGSRTALPKCPYCSEQVTLQIAKIDTPR